MPHVIIKHFPAPLNEARQAELVARVTDAVQNAFGCDEGVISIALDPIDAEDWNEAVYVPEIVNRRSLLRKVPNY
jgi:4-oxalocrotonate tautomerase